MDTKQEVQKKCYVNKWGDIDPQGLSILSLADLKTFTNNGRIFIINKKPLQQCLEWIYIPKIRHHRLEINVIPLNSKIQVM